MKSFNSRITLNPNLCGGKPCIRGLRIRVVDILDLLASGLSHSEVLDTFPDLEEDDIIAALTYAREKVEPFHASADEILRQARSLRKKVKGVLSADEIQVAINQGRP